MVPAPVHYRCGAVVAAAAGAAAAVGKLRNFRPDCLPLPELVAPWCGVEDGCTGTVPQDHPVVLPRGSYRVVSLLVLEELCVEEL